MNFWRFLVQPPAQRSASFKVRASCSGLHPVRFWKPPKTNYTASLDAFSQNHSAIFKYISGLQVRAGHTLQLCLENHVVPWLLVFRPEVTPGTIANVCG